MNRWLLVFFSALVLVCPPACAADWGYEDGFTKEKPDQFETHRQPAGDPAPMPVEELEATPQSLTGEPPHEGAPSKSKSPSSNQKRLIDQPGIEQDTPLGSVENEIASDDTVMGNPVIEHWLRLLGLCAQLNPGVKLPSGPDYSRQLTDSQRQRFAVVLNKLLSGKEKAEIISIEKFWRALNTLLQDEQQRSNYRLLFRSLLSMRADSKDTSDEERTMIFEALGPKRIAEPGPPPLTEDAINAYSDMACFLYERSHSGKTVDAEDNRELYSLIVKDRFFGAPSDRDRQAMNDFPLSWAKFRILYNDASEGEKMLLAERIATKEGTRGLNIRNTMLEEVLSSPAWKRFILAQNARNAAGTQTRTVGATVGRAKKTTTVKRKASPVGR